MLPDLLHIDLCELGPKELTLILPALFATVVMREWFQISAIIHEAMVG